jgi:hypothetical protein
MPPEEEPMPFSTIVQCDLCPALTDNLWKFCKVTVQTETTPEEKNPDGSSNGWHVRKTESLLCPKCAAPLLAFQQAMVDGSGTDDRKRELTSRLNERILSALKKTE